MSLQNTTPLTTCDELKALVTHNTFEAIEVDVGHTEGGFSTFL